MKTMKRMMGIVAAMALAACVSRGGADEADLGDGWKKEEFLIGYGRAQKAWVDDISALEDWKPVEQPDLAQRLGASPKLEVEKVGPPVRMVANTRGHVLLIPNKDATWDALFHYFPSYSGEQEVIIADLGAGLQKTLWFNSKRDGGKPNKVVPFGAWYAHGKLFWAFDATSISWYDPELNDIIYKEFDGSAFHGHCRYLAGDQNIYYVGALPKKKEAGFMAAIFDTEKLEMSWHEPFGPSSMNTTIFYAHPCMDGDWLYAAIGNRPWYLLAYNFKTRENRVLATAPIIGDYKTIKFSLVEGGGVSGYIREPDFVDGITEFDKKEFEFWIRDGKIHARAGATPPWSQEPAKHGGDIEHLFPWSNIQYWPKGWAPPSVPPYFDQEHADSDSDGNVTKRYRWGGKGAWQTITFRVSTYPAATAYLTEVNDHVIFGAGTQYAEHNFFNLKTKQFMGGGASGISTYAMNGAGNLFFVTGYANSKTAYYDLTRPLTREGDVPNPKTIDTFQRYSDTHYPTGGIFGGADGRVYSAGHGAGRTRQGGGWSWYDPATGEVGGEKCEDNVMCITDAVNGRYILMSAQHKDGNRLFCWDTGTHAFIYKEAIDGLDSPGYIVEALPGLVVGHTSRIAGEARQQVLYGLDPLTRKVLWTKEVPAEYKSSRLPLYGGPYFFRRGPDGFVWCYFNQVLVRIDPRTAEVAPVGKLPGKPVFLGFAGGEVYVAGQVGLYKVKGLTVPVVTE